MEQQTINNHTILHTGNHNDMFNPHPQYTLKKDTETLKKSIENNKYKLLMPLAKDYLNKYIELVSIKSKCLYTTSNNTLAYDFKLVMDGNLTKYPTLGEIYIKLNNNKDNSFSETLFMNGNFNVNNFKQILYKEDGYLIYKLYYKLDRNWSSIQCKKEYQFSLDNIYSINHTGELLDELPIIDRYEYKLIKKNF